MNALTSRLTIVVFAFAFLAGPALAQSDAEALLTRAQAMFEPIPTEIPQIEGNPYTPEKDHLGHMLFLDPRLSSSWALSCNSCHNLGMAGVDLQPTSLGHGWQRGGRNSPTMLNAIFNVAQFWDGRAEDLAEQAMGPIQDALEMNNTPEQVMTTLKSMPGYVEAFDAAFPDQEDPMTFENVAAAIEVFESTLLTPNAPFDDFLRGDLDALNEEELAGLDLFMGRGCAGCHMGVNLGGTGYFGFGVVERPDSFILPEDDVGRYTVTNVEADKYVFKSPTLRNIELTPPYFHSGQVWSLRDAVKIMGQAQLGAEFSEQEIDQLVAFLESLTGDQPVVEYPVLPEITSETPLPVEPAFGN